MQANRTLRYFTSHISSLPHLTSKEKDVIIRRLTKIKLTKIGKRYRVTEARIRQIEKKALEKIRGKHYQLGLFNPRNSSVA